MADKIQSLKHYGHDRLLAYLGELRGLWLEMAQADLPALVLAMAFAVGTLISMVPIPVVDMMIAGMVMRLARRLPRGPVVAAMAVYNSFVMAPVYATSPRIGGFLLSTVAAHSRFSLADALLPRLIVGNIAVAIGLAAFSFVLAATVFSALRWQQSAARVAS